MEDERDHSSLEDLDADYEAAESERPDFENVPDGKYQVIVEKVSLKDVFSEAKGKYVSVLNWQLRIISGSHKGKMIFRSNFIATPQNAAFLKQDLYIVGLKLAKLSDLHEHLEELLDVKLAVSVRTKGEYTNCYINRRIEVAEALDTPDNEEPF